MSSKVEEVSLVTVSPVALFRYQVVCHVLARELGGYKRSEAVTVTCSMKHPSPEGRARTVKVRTLYRWLSAFGQRGISGLEPKGRKKTDVSEVLSEALVAFVRAEKTDDPRASIPEIIRRAERRKLIASEQEVSRTTVWRAVARMGLPTRVRPSKAEGDMRRFAYPNRMMMILCDVNRFRVGTERLRRVALFFLDDATRKGLHVVVGTDETTELFLRGVYELIRKVGLMTIAFLDNGSGFISKDTFAVFSKLPGTHLINGTAAYPEGHGKIERFNRTALADVIRGFDKAADVDPDCEALTLRLQHYLDHQYNLRGHESLGRQSPNDRWNVDPRPLRFPQDEDELQSFFVVTEGRTVSADHVIRYGGLEYEAPRGLGHSKVQVHRQVLTGELFLVHEGRTVRLQPVDKAANARTKRSQGPQIPVNGEGVPRTAASDAFDGDFGPVVDSLGGFVPPTKKEK